MQNFTTPMTTQGNFSQLLRDLARRAGVPETQSISEDGQVLIFEPNLEVSISYSARKGLVLLSCPLGELDIDEPAETYRSLLEANLFWLETDGATVSLDGLTNRVFLADQRALALTSVEELEQWLNEFVRAAEKWTLILKNRKAESSVQVSHRKLA